MTGHELQQIRRRLGLTALELGRALGYDGTDATTRMLIHRFESGGRAIPPAIERLVQMFDLFEVPEEFLDTRPIRLKELKSEIAAATNVRDLRKLLIEYDDLRKEMALSGANEPDYDIIPEITDFDRGHDRWIEYMDEPLAADETHVLFREQVTGRYYVQPWSDVLSEEEEE